jgi:hypothetical protein
VVASTVAENGPLMAELFGAAPCAFLPSVPNLVYQYSLYCRRAVFGGRGWAGGWVVVKWFGWVVGGGR